MQEFDYYDSVDQFRNLSDVEFLEKLSRPTLFKLKGASDKKAVLISTLLHGSEPCGLRAFLHELTLNRSYQYDVYVLVGNVRASQQEPLFTHRNVEEGQNFNRIWFADPPQTQEEKEVHAVFEFIKELPLQAVLDLHSFTGTGTPPHCMFPRMSARNHVVYFAKHCLLFGTFLGALVERTSELAPSFVIECGRNNTPEADEYAILTLERFLIHFDVIEGDPLDPLCEYVYSGEVNFKFRKDLDFEKEITLEPSLGLLNMRELHEDIKIATCDSLDVLIPENESVHLERYFVMKEGALYIRKGMFTNLLSNVEYVLKESGFYVFDKRE